MALHITFNPLAFEDIESCAKKHKEEGYRCVQMLCTNTDDGIDMQYTYMKDDNLENFTVKAVTKDMTVPSITKYYLSAFFFENEAHDLFGVTIDGNLLDFGGKFYAIAENEPMTFISPEQKAAKEKAAKIAAAKAAKAAQVAKAKAEEETAEKDGE
ncbi:MAG: NADH-quinone oxidoreductase subunit C [Raoultibacter sp.]|jgi:hypothetical protein